MFIYAPDMHPDAEAGWVMMSESPCQCLALFIICYVIGLFGFGSMFTWGLLWSLWFPFTLILAAILSSTDFTLFCLW
jgi:hypothetical protein